MAAARGVSLMAPLSAQVNIGPAEIIAILIALALIVGVVGWLYQFTRDR